MKDYKKIGNVINCVFFFLFVLHKFKCSKGICMACATCKAFIGIPFCALFLKINEVNLWHMNAFL